MVLVSSGYLLLGVLICGLHAAGQGGRKGVKEDGEKERMLIVLIEVKSAG